MPNAKRQVNRSNLARALERTDWRQWFRDARLEHSQHDWQWVIDHFVGRTTFRAFHHMPEPPSKVFREWARDALFGQGRRFEQLSAVSSQAAYDLWLHLLAENLRRRWSTRMGQPMPFGPSLKLPNLIMKGICACPKLEQTAFDRIVWWLHVPLDSYLISVVRDHIAASPFAAARIGPIPKYVTMGFVKNEDMYRIFQESIRTLAQQAGVPPITLDILAWDNAHPRKTPRP
jgi:hypothetical protein